MFEKIIRINQTKTFFVLAVYICLFIFIGLIGDIIRINAISFSSAFYALISFKIFPLITVLMAGIACAIIFYSISRFQGIMLSGNEYKELTKKSAITPKEKEIVSILEELLVKSNTPFTPRLYLLQAPYMNAFASGWDSHNSLIALTTTLTQSLNRDEIKAVMAHELSHIRHGDIRLTLIVGILTNILTLAINFISIAFFGGNRNEGANLARTILLILTFVVPLLTLILQLFLSRSREYMADSGAAFIMQTNMPMISALRKISGHYAQYDFKEVDSNPTRKAAYIFSVSEVFSTHPSIENRIRALRNR
ncbi:zinc metalloprotease HtpX [Helicobacter monodelphidis]|uniref:zinc metalloprotease HtpX n=1 Tax=Helicobacter sp. 15-1451 TaxID=2004995 RepID=UPI000DCB3C11|nr:zinc metalloprotease HtpX [Helicobacter sp. 15-1451]RAX57716.1 zinc metalloprotease HtpX [Helicobacter sp. 15-1451]